MYRVRTVTHQLPCASGTYATPVVSTRAPYVQYGGPGTHVSAQWMTLPLELSMGLPFSARHAPRVCSENWTKEASVCRYMRLGAPCALHEAGQPSHTFNEAIDAGERSQMLAKGWAHAPSLARKLQLTLAFGHPFSSHGQGPPSARLCSSMENATPVQRALLVCFW